MNILEPTITIETCLTIIAKMFLERRKWTSRGQAAQCLYIELRESGGSTCWLDSWLRYLTPISSESTRQEYYLTVWPRSTLPLAPQIQKYLVI
ncbi:MAG TPA: hypothetical protein VF884_05060 [Nitrososphaeraceae archaeon]